MKDRPLGVAGHWASRKLKPLFVLGRDDEILVSPDGTWIVRREGKDPFTPNANQVYAIRQRAGRVIVEVAEDTWE